MTRPTGVLRAWLLAAALSINTTAAISIQTNPLFARDNTCGVATYTRCPQAGFPDNFCCEAGSFCIPLAGNTTILCCPDGDDCGTIKAIVCNLQLQDASTNPQALVKTTALTSVLPKCGSNCCPFGYTCDADLNCVKEQDQSKKPQSVTDASTTASTPASTPASTGQASTATPTIPATGSTGTGITATAAPEGGVTQGQTNPAESHTEGVNTSAIVGGVVGGVLLLIAVAIGVIYLLYRRRRAAERKRLSDQSFVSKGVITSISHPIPQDGFTYGRSDFIVKSSPSVGSTPSQAQEGFDASRQPYDSRYSYASRDSARRSVGEDDARSYHPSAIIPGLGHESRADDERHPRRGLSDYSGYEEVPLGLERPLTQWPKAQPGPGDQRL